MHFQAKKKKNKPSFFLLCYLKGFENWKTKLSMDVFLTSNFAYPPFHQEKGILKYRNATHRTRRRKWHLISVLLPGKIPWAEEPGRLQSMGSLKIGHD